MGNQHFNEKPIVQTEQSNVFSDNLSNMLKNPYFLNHENNSSSLGTLNMQVINPSETKKLQTYRKQHNLNNLNDTTDGSLGFQNSTINNTQHNNDTSTINSAPQMEISDSPMNLTRKRYLPKIVNKTLNKEHSTPVENFDNLIDNSFYKNIKSDKNTSDTLNLNASTTKSDVFNQSFKAPNTAQDQFSATSTNLVHTQQTQQPEFSATSLDMPQQNNNIALSATSILDDHYKSEVAQNQDQNSVSAALIGENNPSSDDLKWSNLLENKINKLGGAKNSKGSETDSKKKNKKDSSEEDSEEDSDEDSEEDDNEDDYKEDEDKSSDTSDTEDDDDDDDNDNKKKEDIKKADSNKKNKSFNLTSSTIAEDANLARMKQHLDDAGKNSDKYVSTSNINSDKSKGNKGDVNASKHSNRRSSSSNSDSKSSQKSHSSSSSSRDVDFANSQYGGSEYVNQQERFMKNMNDLVFQSSSETGRFSSVNRKMYGGRSMLD